MNDKLKPRPFTRRQFLRLSGQGGLAMLLTGSGLLSLTGARKALALEPPNADLTCTGPDCTMRLAATDGYIQLPGRGPLLVFGFVQVPDGVPVVQLDSYKGNVQVSSPIIGVDEGNTLVVTVTNIGLFARPDLDDSHTIHWHGFRNPASVFDGVPEVSIAVPPARDFPFFFHPEDPGTYMYHCHFEDVEHVQMGMNGIVFVRPQQNYTGVGDGRVARLGGNPESPLMGYLYNDGVTDTDPLSTAYDREFTLMLNEIDTRPHDLLENLQEFVWSGYKANYWIINGRAYPHTILPNNDPSLPNQPISSLIQCNPGERVALRFANLGYEQHAMQLPGITMKVVGHDATLLRGPAPDNADISYFTDTVYIGPGEARDVLFQAPAFQSGPAVSDGDGLGPYNRYYLRNRAFYTQTNDGQPGLGGMVTEVRVYQGPLPQQAEPNETYPLPA